MADSLISTVDLVLLDKMRFQATNARGVAAILDSPIPFGDGAGLTPMEFLLAGLAGCTAMDVISILRKKRLEVTEYRVQVMGVRAPEHPKIYTDITIRHIVSGYNVSGEALRHAIELSEEKYCSAYAMLRQAATISTSYEVREPEVVMEALLVAPLD